MQNKSPTLLLGTEDHPQWGLPSLSHCTPHVTHLYSCPPLGLLSSSWSSLKHCFTFIKTRLFPGQPLPWPVYISRSIPNKRHHDGMLRTRVCLQITQVSKARSTAFLLPGQVLKLPRDLSFLTSTYTGQRCLDSQQTSKRTKRDTGSLKVTHT